MIIVGGTYDEICFEPRWEEKVGSGLRACRVVTSIDPNLRINYCTFGNENTKLYLSQIQNQFTNIDSVVTEIADNVVFYYDHPLINPRIFPRPDAINKSSNEIRVKGDNILYYGMIEGNAI